MPKTGLAQTKKSLPSLPTALPCVDLPDGASESQAALEDDEGLIHDGDEEDVIALTYTWVVSTFFPATYPMFFSYSTQRSRSTGTIRESGIPFTMKVNAIIQ